MTSKVFKNGAVAAALLLSVAGQASALTYYDGIEDSLLVLQEQYADTKGATQTIKSNGYVLYAQIGDLSSPELVNYSAIGYRSGYPVFFAHLPSQSTIIVFDTYERKADALYAKKKLESSYGLKHLNIEFYPKPMTKEYVIAKKIIDYIDKSYDSELRKEKERCGKEVQAVKDAFAKIVDGKKIEAVGKFSVDKESCREYIEKDRLAHSYECPAIPTASAPVQPAPANIKPVVIKGPLQVVNRVVTKAFLDKNYGGSTENAAALRSKYARRESYKNQTEAATKNVIAKNDALDKLKNADSLNAFFGILRGNAAIAPGGDLIVSGKAISPGAKIGRYTLFKTDYRKGIVVVKHNAHIVSRGGIATAEK